MKDMKETIIWATAYLLSGVVLLSVGGGHVTATLNLISASDLLPYMG